MVTTEGMLNIELLSTRTSRRQPFRLPHVSEVQSVSKCSLVEAESMFYHWKNSQPVGGAFLLVQDHCSFCCSSKACASRSAFSSITLLFFAFTSFLACSWFAFISLLYVGSLIMYSIRGCVTSLLFDLFPQHSWTIESQATKPCWQGQETSLLVSKGTVS